jgi:hypothetical protein
MRKIAFALFAVLVVAGAASAQQDMGNYSLTGVTYTTGIVETADSSAIALREDSGRLVTILLSTQTVNVNHATPGTRVRVNFHTDDQNRPVADEIQGIPEPLTEKVTPEPKVTYTDVATPPAAAPEPYVAPAPEPAPVPAEPEPLPKTASSIPAIALVGLLSFAAALAVRFVR